MNEEKLIIGGIYFVGDPANGSRQLSPASRSRYGRRRITDDLAVRWRCCQLSVRRSSSTRCFLACLSVSIYYFLSLFHFFSHFILLPFLVCAVLRALALLNRACRPVACLMDGVGDVTKPIRRQTAWNS